MCSHNKNIIGDIPIYYINLERAFDRKEAIEKFFNDNNINNYKRVEGIDGKNISKEFLSKSFTLNENPDLNIFDMACALSHYKAIESVYNDKCRYALIIEDDCNFEYLKYQTYSLNNIINHVKSWNVIKLSMINSINSKSRKNTKRSVKVAYKNDSSRNIIDINKLIKQKYVQKHDFGYNGLQGYLINYETCKKILENKNSTILGASEPTLFKNIVPHVVVPPYLTYYYYRDIKSHIRTGKDGHATQTYSKLYWDNYYKKNSK